MRLRDWHWPRICRFLPFLAASKACHISYASECAGETLLCKIYVSWLNDFFWRGLTLSLVLTNVERTV